MSTHDPLRIATEIREQLASEKRRLIFFLGAGTSMSVGIPGIEEITRQIPEKITGSAYKSLYERMQKDMPDCNVEHILTRLRTIRELIGGNKTKSYDDMNFSVTKNLDSAICAAIRKIVSDYSLDKLKNHLLFAQWIHSVYINRYYPVELFTTNYDLLLEQAMEEVGLPFFDGFVGSVKPFFAPESIEADESTRNTSLYPPKAWTRLWKIHGSINWISQPIAGGKQRTTRLSGVEPNEGEELMIFPSREKYSESRKLPFMTFQDHFRRVLSSGETLLIILGYSFSDQHINEIIFQGLRSNPRLAVTALMYGDKVAGDNGEKLILSETIANFSKDYRNLTIYGPDKGCVGGIIAPWGEPFRKNKGEDWPFWDEQKKHFKLGDFASFAEFLEKFIGLGGRISFTNENPQATEQKPV